MRWRELIEGQASSGFGVNLPPMLVQGSFVCDLTWTSSRKAVNC
jgi:hypothetical protein